MGVLTLTLIELRACRDDHGVGFWIRAGLMGCLFLRKQVDDKYGMWLWSRCLVEIVEVECIGGVYMVLVRIAWC